MNELNLKLWNVEIPTRNNKKYLELKNNLRVDIDVEQEFGDAVTESLSFLFLSQIKLILIMNDLPTINGNDGLTDTTVLEELSQIKECLIVLGASGSGKTRTLIELLCKKYGFYFTGLTKDDLDIFEKMTLNFRKVPEYFLNDKIRELIHNILYLVNQSPLLPDNCKSEDEVIMVETNSESEDKLLMAKTNHGETQELPTEEKIEYNPTEENEENVDLITGENKDETELDLHEPSVIHVNEDNSEESLNWNMIKKKVETYRNQLKKGKYAVE
ncbi:hypothetical protein GLOIN_2v1776858 [Rhizophagus irregularis DAOM 181602=DAOM 197198]|uniref:Uncharacterized protein n=1 Tax=Rhizophagus irregularis (strain DAOM 181602 / DAOM 197198 / MUCL 43194) TaxID=747089 RepID=A0A2P4PVV5_RHIID|nr:hypothetical protein GLOIN_2v1776858 [Rhizophagus irregularis DAOM 181602=DAOM 197198]POG69533.1 hypothetical protein GLOIN_2v1776858 [Rhizophagus irregularis DAOM 181602=DAOM 197198]|eukprot:XP_025176399.1 hypothetical protein GLOIN_2v1776858 [Rhizophagus irregularis DAOM 181602=DAOM 197198]